LLDKLNLTDYNYCCKVKITNGGVFMRLGDLADISTGLVINRKAADVIDTNIKKYKLLTLKSFDDDGWINDEFIDLFNSSEVLSDKYLTTNRDLVIRLTSPYTCIPITEDTEGLLVPSQFALIRITDKSVNPYYLAYALNSETIRMDYVRTSLGATIPVIRVATLRATRIPIPNLRKQEIVANIWELKTKQKKLYHQLIHAIEEKDKQIEIRIMEEIENGK